MDERYRHPNLPMGGRLLRPVARESQTALTIFLPRSYHAAQGWRVNGAQSSRRLALHEQPSPAVRKRSRCGVPGRKLFLTPASHSPTRITCRRDALHTRGSGPDLRLRRSVRVRRQGREPEPLIRDDAHPGAVLAAADPADKAQVYRGINLVQTYEPAAQAVKSTADLSEINMGL